jgi:hypothetical protein
MTRLSRAVFATASAVLGPLLASRSLPDAYAWIPLLLITPLFASWVGGHVADGRPPRVSRVILVGALCVVAGAFNGCACGAAYGLLSLRHGPGAAAPVGGGFAGFFAGMAFSVPFMAWTGCVQVALARPSVLGFHRLRALAGTALALVGAAGLAVFVPAPLRVVAAGVGLAGVALVVRALAHTRAVARWYLDATGAVGPGFAVVSTDPIDVDARPALVHAAALDRVLVRTRDPGRDDGPFRTPEGHMPVARVPRDARRVKRVARADLAWMAPVALALAAALVAAATSPVARRPFTTPVWSHD